MEWNSTRSSTHKVMDLNFRKHAGLMKNSLMAWIFLTSLTSRMVISKSQKHSQSSATLLLSGCLNFCKCMILSATPTLRWWLASFKIWKASAQGTAILVQNPEISFPQKSSKRLRLWQLGSKRMENTSSQEKTFLILTSTCLNFLNSKILSLRVRFTKSIHSFRHTETVLKTYLS